MSDNSFIGALHIVLRPFVNELDETWKIVRGVCIASFIVAVCLWFFSFLASPEHFSRAKVILNITAWLAFIIFFFSYVSIYWEILILDKEVEQERHKKVTGFTNVEK